MINTPDILQSIFRLLDLNTLARLARVHSVMMPTVAQRLYREVSFHFARSDVSRTNVSAIYDFRHWSV